MDNTTPQSNHQQRSFIARLFRSRILRGIAFVIFCLVTVAFLVLAEENWRGRRAWEKFRQEWEAKGERFDLASFIPKPVPPDQNFAMTPFLAPLFDYEFVNSTARWRDSNSLARATSVSIYLGENSQQKSPSQGNWMREEYCDLQGWQVFYRGNTNFPANPQQQDPARDVLFALQKYDPILAELRTASRRPHAIFPIHYQELLFGPGEMIHFEVVKGLSRLAQLHALANLEGGRSDEALADVNLCLRLADSLKLEPLLISQLVRISILQISIQPVWEGLARHRWTRAQLEELQKTLASLDLLEEYSFTMRGERAYSNEMMARYRAGGVSGNGSGTQFPPAALRVLMPTGLFYQNQLVINRLHQGLTLPTVDVAQHRVYPEKCSSNVVSSALGKHTPYNMLARMLFPAFDRAAQRFARTQAAIDFTTVACALERYRIANNKYPEILDVLTPRFIAKLPPDVINGQPLKYRLDESGQPVIYSIGWNETDDGGLVVLTKGSTPTVDANKGDWVWQYPGK